MIEYVLVLALSTKVQAGASEADAARVRAELESELVREHGASTQTFVKDSVCDARTLAPQRHEDRGRKPGRPCVLILPRTEIVRVSLAERWGFERDGVPLCYETLIRAIDEPRRTVWEIKAEVSEAVLGRFGASYVGISSTLGPGRDRNR